MRLVGFRGPLGLILSLRKPDIALLSKPKFAPFTWKPWRPSASLEGLHLRSELVTNPAAGIPYYR